MMLNIFEETVGKEYLEMLEKMVEIRTKKREIYHDTYLEDSYDFLILQIENKLKRIRLHLTNDSSLEGDEKAVDNALDAANYILFLAIKLTKVSENGK